MQQLFIAPLFIGKRHQCARDVYKRIVPKINTVVNKWILLQKIANSNTHTSLIAGEFLTQSDMNSTENMGGFVAALANTTVGFTENGMRTNTTTNSACLDLFFNGGAMRKAPEDKIISLFNKAYAEDSELALRILCWIRDARGGAGERRFFRICLRAISGTPDFPTIFKRLCGMTEFPQFYNDIPDLVDKSVISQLARWDDLWDKEMLINDQVLNQCVQLWASLWFGKDLGYGKTASYWPLVCKWTPRKGVFFEALRRHFEKNVYHRSFYPKELRDRIVQGTKVVETQMCAQKWDEIEYSHVPSQAFSLYKRAFRKHDETRFDGFVDAVNKGEAKLNASVLYPYQVFTDTSNKDACEAQWKSLPNYLEGREGKILCMCDVSGSMCSVVSGKTSALTVCLSLGLYTSERNKGPFQNAFLVFSETPKFHVCDPSKSIVDRYRSVSEHNAQNTDLQKAFTLILQTAVDAKLPASDMPETLLVLSDMEFDQATSRMYYNPTAIRMIREMYHSAGYTVPNVVFWNLCARNSNFPVKQHETGTALISGFSPAILKSLLSGDEMTPHAVMMRTVMQDRYTLPV